MSTKLSDYNYPLPEELIAKRPLLNRDESRMMVLHRDSQTIEHREFRDLKNFLRIGDLLVLNDTRVLAARVFSDDHAIEFLLLEKLGIARWKCWVKPGRKMRIGSTTKIADVRARVEEILPEGERVIVLDRDIDLYAHGSMPLPPYLGRESDLADSERYQTVFAQALGAVAAPTAGLHFTAEMLDAIPHAFVTLHVGPGTFKPVHSENVAEHHMHSESFSISAETAKKIDAAQRVIAVGTTTVRTLDFAARNLECFKHSTLPRAEIEDQSGEVDLFIYPPFEFQVVDALLTNFHLPGSTLLMLVSAFAGREFVLRAYAEAIRERYRFYSYGDCMLIL
ncbi:MAG TPA: tRNA preQ1(34) S-adenosylmethionine ribosyltransferase-isomerase QueA [Chthoniobacterales bacterium]|nr:tRNA preQ1(34) S-adenosylmethionine ribosyltransferase-isomerase QueA [Chthoniobacterales bacterium]